MNDGSTPTSADTRPLDLEAIKERMASHNMTEAEYAKALLWLVQEVERLTDQALRLDDEIAEAVQEVERLREALDQERSAVMSAERDEATLEREELRRLRERITTHPGSADDGWSALASFDRLVVRLAALQAELRHAEQEVERLTAENESLIEVAHQIVGFSRTVQGDQPTVRAIAANANALLAPQPKGAQS